MGLFPGISSQREVCGTNAKDIAIKTVKKKLQDGKNEGKKVFLSPITFSKIVVEENQIEN